MELQKILFEFSVCKVTDYTQVDFNETYCFIGKTDTENSLVCLSNRIPENTVACENGWRAFRIQGILDFSLVGVLAEISAVLTEQNISIFAVSTFDTDYIFIKKENFERALQALSARGYTVV